MTYVRGLFTFLYDFLVGDAWELFVGPLVVLALGALLVGAGVQAEIVGVLLFLGVVGVMAVNLVLALRHAT
ncbi:MAG TPA: hypothetical protein VGM28_10765 [Candidatus Limnocylindrales bacterium]|jgi:hypothetical protein